MPPFATIAWLVGAIACVACIVERTRADLLAPTDIKLKLRSFGLAWVSGDFARYAYHEAPEPTRARLRRSAWAYVVFLSCWTVGAVWLLGWIGLLGVALVMPMMWRLLRP